MSNNLTRRPIVTRILARPNITHVALKAELLVHEIHVHLRADDLSQADVASLHTLVANALLFLNPDGQIR